MENAMNKDAMIEALVNDNYATVAKIAKQFRTIDFDDAVSAGHEALFLSARKFISNQTEGDFGGYAAIAIKNAMIDVQRKQMTRARILPQLSSDYVTEEGESVGETLEDLADDYSIVDLNDLLSTFVSKLNPSEAVIMALRVKYYVNNEDVSMSKLAAVIAEVEGGAPMAQGTVSKKVAKLAAKFHDFAGR